MQRFILGLCFLLFLTRPITVSQVMAPPDNVLVSENRKVLIQQESDQPIVLEGDEDFVNYDFEGVGNVTHPYLIKDLVIHTAEFYAIQIVSISKYIVIENCTLISSAVGISVEDCTIGTIRIFHNEIIPGMNGSVSIMVRNVPCVNISQNKAICIEIVDSPGAFISHNEISSQKDPLITTLWAGILLSDSLNSTILSNHIKTAGMGIFLSQANYSSVMHNFILVEKVMGEYGIYLQRSREITLFNNSLFNFGVFFELHSLTEMVSFNISQNTMNGLPLGYFKGVESQTISEEHGQIILINCSNVIIKNQVIEFTTYALHLFYCQSLSIVENQLNNNIGAIEAFYCSDTAIMDNIIMNNIISLYIFFSERFTIANNTIAFNREGIDFYNTVNSLITNNLIQENQQAGVDLNTGSSNNIIHHNTFYGNSFYYHPQGSDDSHMNLWYDNETKEGNYWADWSGTNSYKIGGWARSEDLYPLKQPPVPIMPPKQTYPRESSIPLPFLSVIGPLLLIGLLIRRKRSQEGKN